MGQLRELWVSVLAAQLSKSMLLLLAAAKFPCVVAGVSAGQLQKLQADVAGAAGGYFLNLCSTLFP